MNTLLYGSNASNPSASENKPVKSQKHSAPFLFNAKHYLRNLRSSSAPIVEPKELS